LRWAGHITCKGAVRNADIVSVVGAKEYTCEMRCTWEDKIKMKLKEKGWELCTAFI
jgi:hypothetical protein